MQFTNDMNIKSAFVHFISIPQFDKITFIIDIHCHFFECIGCYDLVDYISYFIRDNATGSIYELYQYKGDSENYYLITDKKQFTDLEFYGYSL